MESKKVSLMDFEGNPNIGIYMFANDKFCLIGQDVSESKEKEISRSLNVPVYKVTVLDTELVGVFLSGNSEVILAPQMHDYEKKVLQDICDKHLVKLIEIEHKLNTLGNNICVADKKVILSEGYEKENIEKIKKSVGYKVVQISSKKFKAVGSTFKFLNGGFFISHEYDEQEVKQIIDDIAAAGTVNRGSNYISSGIVGNSFGVIIGSVSTSVEIQNIVESLDYI